MRLNEDVPGRQSYSERTFNFWIGLVPARQRRRKAKSRSGSLHFSLTEAFGPSARGRGGLVSGFFLQSVDHAGTSRGTGSGPSPPAARHTRFAEPPRAH